MALNVTPGVGGTLKSRLDGPDHVVAHDVYQAGSWSMTITGLPGSLVGYAEDSVHSSGHVGLMTLVVRSDAGGSLVGSDGDYAPLQVDANGALRVTGGGGGTEYTEDAASAANPAGGQLILRRRDTLSGSEVSADGDNIAANATAKGELHVKHADSVAITAAALPLPTGAASETTLASALTALQLIDNAISGAGFNITQLAGVGVSLNTGVRDAGTLRVTIATNDSVPVTGTFWQATQPVSGTFWQATQPVSLASLPTLAAGTNNIGDVDVLSLPALPAGSNLIGNVGTVPLTSGGCSGYSVISAGAVLSVEIKGSPGQVYGIQAFNVNASPRYVRIYNQTGAPGSGDGSNIVWRGIIPGNTSGGGFAVPLPGPIACGTGIGIRASTGIADTDTGALAANELTFNVQYK